MTKEEFEQLIDTLLNYKFEITMRLEDGVRWNNLHSGMKSHLWIAYVDGKCIWQGRYDKKGEIEDLDDLRWVGRQCLCGRDYASAFWWDFINGTSHD